MVTANLTQIELAKQAAGQAAMRYVEDGMVIGLGTGSTVFYFLEALANKCREGLSIKGVATSDKTERLALQWAIPLADSKDISGLDLTIDGADEIDIHKNMTKGGGGALLREKLTALSSKEMIAIIDETKMVHFLGAFPIPVEIVPYLYMHTVGCLKNEGYAGNLRRNQNQSLYTTDNGNYIYDIQFADPVKDPLKEHHKLKAISGIIETGLFCQIANKIIVGYKNGTAQIHT